MTPKKEPYPYNAADFTAVEESLREKWQEMVEHDVNQSAMPATPYREWQVFSRLVFAPWHVRTEIADTQLVEDAIDHCCDVLSRNRLRDKLVPYLLRRKATVADYTTHEGKKTSYFKNDIERILYMMYEQEVNNYVNRDTKRLKISAGDADEVCDHAMRRLRNAIQVPYIQENEQFWPSYMRRIVLDRLRKHAFLLKKGKYRHKTQGPVSRHSISDTLTPENEAEWQDIIGKIDDKAIRLVASAEAILTLLDDITGADTKLLGKREKMVLRAFCENLLAGEPKDNKEMAYEFGMTPQNFGATLSNAAKSIKKNEIVAAKFRSLSENRDEDGPRR